MTGKDLFCQAIRDRQLSPLVPGLRRQTQKWETASERTRRLYTFIATCTGPLTGEQLFNKVLQAGLFINTHDWNARSENFRRLYDYLASQLSNARVTA